MVHHLRVECAAGTGGRYLYAVKITDHSGNEMWSINLVVGDESEQYTDGGQVFSPYPKPEHSA